MSIPSCHSLQMPFDSESMPTSNDHQPLPGHFNFTQWSEEDISNLIAAIQSGELSPELCAQLDAVLRDTEDVIPMSNDHQPLPDNSNSIRWSEQDGSNLVAAIQSGEPSPEVRTQSDVLFNDTEDSISMSNDHQPLADNHDVNQWSEEDTSNLVAAIQSGDSSPEVCAKLDALFNDTEDFLRDINETILAGPANAHVNGSNYDESLAPQQDTSDDLEYVQDPQAPYPTSENFTAPVAGPSQLPQSDPELPPQPSAVPEAHPQDHAWPQHEFDPAYVMNGPPSVYYKQPSAAPGGLQNVRDPQASPPTLENFTAPVADLPQSPQSNPEPYYPPESSAVPEAPSQDHAWPQHEYDPGYVMNEPPSAHDAQPSAAPQGPAWSQHEYNPQYHANAPPDAYYSQPSAVVQAPLQGYAPPQHGCHPIPSHSNQQPHNVAGPSNANYLITAFPQGQDASLQTGSSEGTSVESSFIVLDWKTKPPKRNSSQTTRSRDGSSVAQKPQKRRRLNEPDGIQGKFGPYTLVDANATVMAMPVHDPKPVDISSRRTLDPRGNPLRTRRFGVMELDDSSFHAPSSITKNLSPGLTCVRACDWADQPCGLFIEMDKSHVDDHLWYWHGVAIKGEVACQFEDCPDEEAMTQLGRHVESVHFATAYRCPYCMKLRARKDSLLRHLRVCQQMIACKMHAVNGGYEFCPREITKSANGYIVPAANAT